MTFTNYKFNCLILIILNYLNKNEKYNNYRFKFLDNQDLKKDLKIDKPLVMVRSHSLENFKSVKIKCNTYNQFISTIRNA